ncbi:ribbon-helix-helix domain-containing protein [Streptomyces sp. NPDC005774]|uniref:ribbon-helix-helix domain-containing protein n=1 Tax=Streptomyces sp. NPDC005774 TaxID=3364728 RepID=UPI0036A8831E
MTAFRRVALRFGAFPLIAVLAALWGFLAAATNPRIAIGIEQARVPTSGSMAGMRISVSLPQEDVAFIDEYAAGTEAESRSAVMRVAIELLRQAQLEQAYTEAFAEWDCGGEAGPWDRVSGDGVTSGAW